MDKNNLILACAVVLLLAVGAGFLGYRLGLNPNPPAPAQSGSPAASDTILDKVSWSFEELEPQGEDSVPQTSVTLSVNGTDRKHNVGTYAGSCSVIGASSSWPLLENERTGVICWWAGGGSEVGIFEENGKLLVKVGELEEGNAEVQGSRGSFKLLFPFN